MSAAWQRFLVASDIHGDKQDKKAIEALFQFAAAWKPEIRVINGDLWDFRPLRCKASAEEKRESMIADYEAGNKFLHRFKPTHFIRGNHDERLWDLAQKNDGILSDFALRAIGDIREDLRKLNNCRMLPYHKRDGILRLGHLKITHGFGGAGVNAARRHASVYGSILVGHFHSIQMSSIEGLENRIGRICGCLCQLDMEYNKAHLGSLMHRHGFAYGVVSKRSGIYHIWQAESVNGKWMLPSDITELS